MKFSRNHRFAVRISFIFVNKSGVPFEGKGHKCLISAVSNKIRAVALIVERALYYL